MVDSHTPPPNFPLQSDGWTSLLRDFESKLAVDFEKYKTRISQAVGAPVSSPAEIVKILQRVEEGRKITLLPKPPSLAVMARKEEGVEVKIKAVQVYLNRLGYNHLLLLTYPVNKTHSFRRLVYLARTMIVNGLPIKCLEATILALYLTSPIINLIRIPIAFKSTCNGNTHRHIVLGVNSRPEYNEREIGGRGENRWGTVGLSRRVELGGKEMGFRSISELLLAFKESYERNSHALIKVKIGFPVTHDILSSEPLVWKYFSVNLIKTPWSDISTKLEDFVTSIRLLQQ